MFSIVRIESLASAVASGLLLAIDSAMSITHGISSSAGRHASITPRR